MDCATLYREATLTVREPIIETLAGWTLMPAIGPYVANLDYFGSSAILTGVGVNVTTSNSTTLNSTGWTFAASNTRAWQVSFKTEGFKNVNLTSIQIGNNKSPNNFVLEYSLNDAAWTQIATSVDSNDDPVYEYYIRLASDRVATEKALDIQLPSQCDDQAVVSLRWRSVNDRGQTKQ
jgi:hypothetical protein